MDVKMDAKINYSKITEQIIKEACKDGKRPSLLLHSCCAPCSTSVIESLNNSFDITLFYYNPNITDENEYNRRKIEQIDFIQRFNSENPIRFIEGDYKPEEFYEMASGMENHKEGGIRCALCYKKRLEETARMACKNQLDYFTTTLTVSPYKNVDKINKIGKALAEEFKVHYLYSDFKKKKGYERSVEMSKLFDLYRQDYCGCEFSKNHT
jgi:predicted adenine nucleotide alpha hydrolase (AANH) superfamily ATPase